MQLNARQRDTSFESNLALLQKLEIILFILFSSESLASAAVEQRQRESLFCLEPIGRARSYFHFNTRELN